MRRSAGWEKRLRDFIAARRNVPWQWGANDCALFAADAVHALTGVDYAQAFRGRYRDEAGAMAVIAEHGGLDCLVTALLGVEPLGRHNAGRGDVMLGPGREGRSDMLGVCLGQHVAVPADAGLMFLPRSDFLMSWRIE